MDEHAVFKRSPKTYPTTPTSHTISTNKKFPVTLMCLVFFACLFQWSVSFPYLAHAEDDADRLVKLFERQLEMIKQEKHAESIAAGEEALTILKRYGPLQEPKITIFMNHLAKSHRISGNFVRSEELIKEAIGILENADWRDQIVYAISLLNLANLYTALGDHAKAVPLLEQALQIAEKNTTADSPDLSNFLNDLGLAYRNVARYDQAEIQYNRVLKISQEHLGPKHPKTLSVLNNLADLHAERGKLSEAETLCKQVLRIREEEMGPRNPEVAYSLNNLATIYDRQGRFREAEPLYIRALEIREATVGPDHIDTAISLNNLGQYYQKMGDMAKAEPFYRRALAIYEKKYGTGHSGTVELLGNLAHLYMSMADYENAETLLKDSLKLQEKAFGADNPNIAPTLTSLAMLYEDSGAYENLRNHGMDLLRHALKLQENGLGPDHPNLVKTLIMMGRAHMSLKEFQSAESSYQRALAILEKKYGQGHPENAVIHHNLAILYLADRRLDEAETHYSHAAAITEKKFGPRHYLTALTWADIAFLHAARERYPVALSYLKKALEIEDDQIENIFNITTEKQKLGLVHSKAFNYESALILISRHFSKDPEMLRYGLSLVLRRKGIVFDAMSRNQDVLRNRLSASVQKDWNQLAELRETLAHLLLNKSPELDYESYKRSLAKLQKQIEEAEIRLSKMSGLVADHLKQRRVVVRDVAHRLPPRAALVEFVRIQDPNIGRIEMDQGPCYLAFVLNHDGGIQLIDLGSADALDHEIVKVETLIRSWLQDPNEDINKKTLFTLKSLYEKVWRPLSPCLNETDKVLISPDGLLHLIPFAALLDQRESYLLEKYELAAVTSGRDLLSVSGSRAESKLELLLVANPDYDKKISSGGQVVSRRPKDLKPAFAPLPGTAKEARLIPPLLGAHKKAKQVLTGRDATETAIKATVCPRILHIATHGFFLKDEPRLRTRGLIGRDQPRNTARFENPLVRSGLALAGANHAESVVSGDDGILTALEITGMDLHGTDLVVLSACETALGQVANGEGVFGLRRAFALAGAENLLMSLWPVSDQVTVDQMEAFYGNLSKGRSEAEALRQAQLATIHYLKKKIGEAAPALWAPFIIQGPRAISD
jgi:CHAT domain-containing protein/Flp pilus assembly protein TadD